MDGRIVLHNPSKNLLDYLAIGNVMLPEDTFGLHGEDEKIDDSNRIVEERQTEAPKEVEKPKVNVENPFSMNSSVENSGVFNNQTINRPVEQSQPIVNNLNNNVTDLDKTDIIDLDEINRIINNNNN